MSCTIEYLPPNNLIDHWVNVSGALIAESYPVDPKKENSPDVFVYTGLFSAFKQSGFVEVRRRSETRPMMRYDCTL
ncbi:MAG TPA: hypothetical protein ENI15_13505 [Spirochaetes bacterium]|nr:hypothetical protein [Spirochaetota bacterium]